MDSSSSNNNNNYSSKYFDRYFPLAIIKDSNILLSLTSSSSPPQDELSSSIKIAIWKDQRLEHLDISKDLIEILQLNVFTIEMILEYGPSQIAKII